MVEIILLILLSLTLLFFVYALFKAVAASSSQKNALQSTDNGQGASNLKPETEEAKEEIRVKIKRESDGIHIIVPAEIDNDDYDDYFPHIINDTPPDDQGLDMAFWLKVTSLPEIVNPDERERLTKILADNGIISPENASILAMLTPPSEEGGEDAQEPEGETPHTDAVGIQAEEPVIEPVLPPIPSPEESAPQQGQIENKPEPEGAPEEEDDNDFSEHEFNF